MPNSDDFLIVAKTLVAKGQNSCSAIVQAKHEFSVKNTKTLVFGPTISNKLRFPKRKKTEFQI